MTLRSISSFAVALGMTAFVYGDHHEGSSSPGGSESDGLFQSSFLGNYDFVNGKLQSLAEAFSDEQYDWRPAEGVRSTREAILHIAAANYFLSSQLGASMPEGLNPREFESTIHDKEEVLETLKASIEFARKTIQELPEAELGTMVDLFGNEMPYMSVTMIIGGHANEHLGQLIAYARSMGVTPPWSQQEEG